MSNMSAREGTRATYFPLLDYSCAWVHFAGNGFAPAPDSGINVACLSTRTIGIGGIGAPQTVWIDGDR